MRTPADGWDREEREALEPIRKELDALRARHAGDPPLDLLRAANADALPPNLQARVAAHLAESAWCRALVAGAEDVETSLDAKETDRLLARIMRTAAPTRSAALRRPWLPPSGGRFWNTRLWAPLVATAATIAIAVVVWSSWRGVAPLAPAAAPPKPEATIARAPSAPFELPLDKPDVKLGVAALTWRGPGATSLVDDLAPALDAYRQSDYARAAQALDAIERRYPQSIEAPFYRGISLLFLNDPAGAIGELQKAERMKDDGFAADIAWYLAVAAHRAGRTGDARTHLQGLCRQTTPHSGAACDALKRMDAAR